VMIWGHICIVHKARGIDLKRDYPFQLALPNHALRTMA